MLLPKETGAMRITSGWWVAPALLCSAGVASAQAPGGDAVPPPEVTSERLLHAADEPGSWMMYGGSYWNQRYSTLKQITTANASKLTLRRMFQTGIAKLGSFEKHADRGRWQDVRHHSL
jgi:glucose dehydrogenase